MSATMDSVSAIGSPLVRSGAEGQRRWFYGGGVHTWLVRPDEVAGAFMMFEDEMVQGKMTPLHTHPSDESMYVIEGEIAMHLDGTEHHITSGGIAVAPRGLPHAFRVVSPVARLLTLHTPGLCESFYLDASTPLTPELEQVVDFDRVRDSAKRNGGIELLGPPPFS
jgi:quercetin dioxygenase-like cupin family protein